MHQPTTSYTLQAVSDKDDAKAQKAAEKAARETFENAMARIDEGTHKFSSKVRGQAGLILDELIDPNGDTVLGLADVEGDVGALALASPIELITFETWLLGQVGDTEELDLDISAHAEHWFNFGAWIGHTLKLRHGGHWLIAGDDPHTWRMGFSKVMLETAPFVFAEALLRSGAGVGKRLIGEIERLWARAAVRDLAKQVRVHGKKLGEQNAAFLDKLLGAMGQLDQDKPAAAQTNDRGMFEAIAQIIGLRRTAAPLAMDVLEQLMMPAIHMGMPDKFAPLDKDDLDALRRGIELFALFIEVTPFKYTAHDGGFLGVIPNEELRSPYADRTNLEVGKGDWVIVNPSPFKKMLLEFDSKRLLEKYDEFVKYVHSNPKAPRRRDNGRFLAETVANGMADFRSCVVAASKEGHALLFRMLPPPG